MKKFRATSPKKSLPERNKSFWDTFREALHLTFQNRFLWVLGILGGASGNGFGVPLPGDPDQKPQELWQRVVGQVGEQNAVALLLVLIVVGIVLAVLAVILHAGLVLAFDGMTRGQRWDFRKAFFQGKRYFWRLLGQMILIAVVVGTLMVLLIGPAAKVWTEGGTLTLQVTGAVGIAAGLLVGVVTALLFPFAVRFLVLGNHGIPASIRATLTLFRQEFGLIVKAWLAGFVFNLLFLALVVGGFFGVVAIALLIVAALSAMGIPALVAGILVFVPIGVAGLASVGILSSTNSGYWTMIFRRLTP